MSSSNLAYSGSTTPRKLLAELVEQAGSPDRVRSVRLYCTANLPNATVVIVDVHSSAVDTIARRLDGFRFGNSPARLIDPLPPGFQCPGRIQGLLREQSCSQCCHWPPPNA